MPRAATSNDGRGKPVDGSHPLVLRSRPVPRTAL